MAQVDFSKLISKIQSGTFQRNELTFALEEFKNCDDSDLARSVVLPFLYSEHAVLREGALYGIENHINENVIVILRDLSKNDPSRSIRVIAIDMLNENLNESH